MKNREGIESKVQLLSHLEINQITGGNDRTAGHAVTGGLVGTSFGQGVGTLASIANGAATGARWGRWGGGIGLVVGIVVGGAYGAFSAGG